MPSLAQQNRIHWVHPLPEDGRENPSTPSWLKSLTACGRNTLNLRVLFNVSKLVLKQKVTCKKCLERIEKELG